VKLVQFGARATEIYKGIPQGGYTGEHDQVVAMLRRHLPPPGRILDTGAWEGALSLRLHDEGYQVEGTDLDPSAFKPQGVLECLQLDLNSHEDRARFVSERRGAYDAILAVEIIEHIRDPWGFTQFCMDLLRPGGFLLLSTPNVTAFYSRFTFLLKGHMHQFFPEDEVHPGHINPMTSRRLESMFESLGLQRLEKAPVGSLPVFWFGTSPGFMVKWAVAGLLSPLMGADKDGWCLMYLLRRP
jgi:SAM-dependent methyltransferase